jgi:hypothetical protein
MVMVQQQSLSETISFLPITDERWIAYLSENPLATIFHHPAWSQLLADCYGFKPFICATCDTNGHISAGLPIMKIQSWLNGSQWVSLPFTDHCAPLFQNPEALNRLVSGLISLYPIHKIRKVELRWNYQGNNQFSTDDQFTLNTVNLVSGPEAVAARIDRKDFRQIRVSKERGVYVEIGTTMRQLKEFYSLHLQNRRKHGIPVQPWRYFKLLSDHLLKKGYGFLASAYKGQTCISAAVFLYWNKTLIYKYAASNNDGYHLYGMDLILWSAICWGWEHGIQVLDMGRSLKNEKGLRNYKNRWGGEESHLIYSYLPPGNPRSNNNQLAAMGETLIRNSPLWVCRLSGELFYRYFP